MISNLDELIRYSEEVANRFPVISSEIKLCSPGYSEDLIAKVVKEIPYLPDDYFNVVKIIRVTGVSIGLLNLWPTPYGKKDFVTSLIDANASSSNPYLKFYRDNNLAEVARYEANIICLGRKASQIAGQAYFVDISSEDIPTSYKLANSYEELLIIAGNLHDVSMTHEGHEEAGIIEFRSRLTRLGVDDDAAKMWDELARETLS